jgi:hypothetical protein
LSEEDLIRRLSHIEQAIDDLRSETRTALDRTDERLKHVEREVESISLMANRYKGFFVGVLGGGALVGWLIAQWDHIKAMFK